LERVEYPQKVEKEEGASPKEKETDKMQIIKVSEIRTQAKYRMVDVSFLERG